MAIIDSHFTQMELSFFSVGGISQSKTMKLFGQIGSTCVVLMVDSGASQCFVSKKLAQCLALPLCSIDPFHVKLGDGRCLQTSGLCKDLSINLGPLTISLDCYVFPLGGIDVILGISWLETLGNVKMNWQALTMRFSHQGQKVTLRGSHSLFHSPLSLHSFFKLTDVGYKVIIWPCEAVLSEHTLDLTLSPDKSTQLSSVLDTHSSIFSESHSLRPIRASDHAIALQSGVTTISVKSYCYSHH